MSTPQGTASLPESAVAFINAVLQTNPQLAVFDCDGTLWRDNSGELFFYWELDRGMLNEQTTRWARTRYDEYIAGGVGEEQMCGEMVTINAGLSRTALNEAAVAFFENYIAPGIFPDMLELTHRLKAAGCELWAISSTADWVIRPGAERFGIPFERVIAASVEIEEGRCTDRLIRVPTDELKATAIHDLLPRPPDVVFGNSVHDLAMLELAQKAFAINPTDELEAEARRRAWTIYKPNN